MSMAMEMANVSKKFTSPNVLYKTEEVRNPALTHPAKKPMAIVSRGSEAKLVEHLTQLRDAREGWEALIFNLNLLLDEYKSEFQVKIAVNLVYDVLKSYEGGIYVLTDGALVVLVRNLSQAVRHKLIFQLRYLYMDDPLAYTAEGEENKEFCSVHAISSDWPVVHQYCVRRMTALSRGTKGNVMEQLGAGVSVAGGHAARAPAPANHNIDLSTPAKTEDDSNILSARKLALIEEDLVHADLTKALRRQPICVLSQGAPKRVFDELYMHINYMRKLLRTDVDVLSNRWLFKYLTYKLDERVLTLLTQQQGRFLNTATSLNLNVETLLGEAFDAFDAALSPAMKVSMVIEIPALDVLADISAYHIARERLQKQGYRLCIDGLTPQSFVQLDREKLGADLMKLYWNADIAADLDNRSARELTDAIRRSGANRVILSRCDTKAAIDYGQALGISLFQGRHIDQLINPDTVVDN